MMCILFVCHGNICRSPMAEYVFADLARKRGLAERFVVASAATSTEELGQPVHPGTRRVLTAHAVACPPRKARQMTATDYARYDLLVCMDNRNLANMRRIVGGDPESKMHRLLDYTTQPRDVDDPWYTGDFDTTYADAVNGCEALLTHLLRA